MTKEEGLSQLTKDDVLEIIDKANSVLGLYSRTNSIIKDDIFNILEMNCKTLYYPINNDDICGFVYEFKDYKFCYINSYISLEKQIFAAAHELYHILYSDIKKGELLNSEVLDEKESNKKLNKEDLKANRFAAEILVPENILRNELKIRKFDKSNMSIENIIQLMEVFLVSYKTLVKRLYEIDYIDKITCNNFLNINTEDILIWKKRLGLCVRNNERTKIVKLDKLIDMALKLYDKKQITFEKLEYLLSLSNVKPEEFAIYEEIKNYPSEDEIIKMMEE